MKRLTHSHTQPQTRTSLLKKKKKKKKKKEVMMMTTTMTMMVKEEMKKRERKKKKTNFFFCVAVARPRLKRSNSMTVLLNEYGNWVSLVTALTEREGRGCVG